MSDTQRSPPWSLPYCKLNIIITVPLSVCSSHGWTVKLPESNCANMEPASAFLLLGLWNTLIHHICYVMLFKQENKHKECEYLMNF